MSINMNKLMIKLLRAKAWRNHLLLKQQIQMSQQRTLVFSLPRRLDQKFFHNQQQKSFIDRNNSIIMRNLFSKEVLDALQKNPNISLSEIYRDGKYCDNDRYIKKEKYDSLSGSDKDSLTKILFTYTGYYALSKKYINVDEFLSIPFEARKYLSYIFYNADEMNWNAQRCRNKIDDMFENKHFNLKTFIALSDDKKGMLMKFLCLDFNIGMRAIEEGCFTMDEFLSLNVRQQNELCKFCEEYLYRSTLCYTTFIGLFKEVTEIMESFKNLNKEEINHPKTLQQRNTL